MSTTVDDVGPEDAAAIKAFMARVIADSVTRDDELLADLRANVDGNVDWWLAHPQDAAHLQAIQGGPARGPLTCTGLRRPCSAWWSWA